MFEVSHIGLNGFIWFIGVVENRLDPLNLGRCQVRCFGWHTDNLVNIPSANLPWAQTMVPVTSTNQSTPKEGDYVIGFFTDGENAQFPIIMGILPGIPELPPNIGKGFSDPRPDAGLTSAPRRIQSVTMNSNGSGAKITDNTKSNRYPDRLNEPTTNRYYRNEKTDQTIIGQRKQTRDMGVSTSDPGGFKWDEPYPAYNTVPPYNNALETESGHVFEMDDTPGSERIHLAHRSGSFQEIYPSGTKVEKVVKNNYQIILGDDMIHVMGRVSITVDSDVNLLARGNINVIGGNDLNFQIAGTMNLSAGEAINFRSPNFNVDASGTVSLSGQNIFADAGSVMINKGASTPAGIFGAPYRSPKNKSSFGPEPVPIPHVTDYSQLDPEQGYAFVKSLNGTSNTGDTQVVNSTSNTQMIAANTSSLCIPISMLQVSNTCINNIIKFESFSSKAYPDPGTGGQPYTIGYGFTAVALGRPVNLGDTMTKNEAYAILLNILNNKYAQQVKRHITVPCLTQGQFDGLVSFEYNVGEGNFTKSSVLSLTNIGDKIGASNAMLLWNKSNGRVLPGLAIRREAEKAIYLS